uniref:Uncharacterized protein n=1 Tax=Nymphaea colorata TaxID=210225 RepID=A0A5K1CJI6_9MAGN
MVCVPNYPSLKEEKMPLRSSMNLNSVVFVRRERSRLHEFLL